MNTQKIRPKIAVVGAGWAGLSAAVQLAARADVTLFEAGKQAGGRARTLQAGREGFSFLDNGQHILIGAYHGVQTLLRKIGVREETAFLRQPMQWHMADSLQFQAANLPAPLHILFGILTAKKLSLGEKTALLNSMRGLQKRHALNLPDISIGEWLHRQNTSRKMVAGFWQPLVWGALNTPLQTASLNVLCNVLQDGVWADKAGSDYLLPKQDLGGLLAAPALRFLKQRGANIRLDTRVGRLENLPDGRVSVANQAFDAAILAVAPYHAAALMPSETPSSIQTAYEALQYHAITTVYLRYAEAVALPAVMTGLAGGTAQWLLCRGKLGLPENEVAAVISLSDKVGAYKNEEWIARVHADVKALCPHVGEPLAARSITEKRATVASTVARVLPDLVWLQQRRIYPAGDYLHPRYPATLEAAVQSGRMAAELCLNDYPIKREIK
ncbi:MAG: hydroxysqualene dehydroxylase HpnE [Neisseria sp.]|nr:hydroxysqualene dehydroxylase HpnE [Neisseria sp.]